MSGDKGVINPNQNPLRNTEVRTRDPEWINRKHAEHGRFRIPSHLDISLSRNALLHCITKDSCGDQKPTSEFAAAIAFLYITTLSAVLKFRRSKTFSWKTGHITCQMLPQRPNLVIATLSVTIKKLAEQGWLSHHRQELYHAATSLKSHQTHCSTAHPIREPLFRYAPHLR